MANLQTTTDSAKMKITETITERKQVEKEISIPYYFKDEYGNLCKLISNDYYISAKTGFVQTVEVYPVKHFKGRIASGTEITEEEFEAAYDSAMSFIQMMKQDNLPTEEDENVKIDEILYDQR